MQDRWANKKSFYLLGAALLLTLGVDSLPFLIKIKNYLPVSILAVLIFFGGAGIIIGYNYRGELSWSLIILITLIRLLIVLIIHGFNIYEVLITCAIIAVFIDLGSSLGESQLYS